LIGIQSVASGQIPHFENREMWAPKTELVFVCRKASGERARIPGRAESETAPDWTLQGKRRGRTLSGDLAEFRGFGTPL